MHLASRINQHDEHRHSSPGNATERRHLLQRAVLCASCFAFPSLEASAANLPTSTGADLTKTGSIDTLIPIVAMRRSLVNAKSQLSPLPSNNSFTTTPEDCSSFLTTLLQTIPREEKSFKRIFDAYSTPVSYKQKFLDQNAFLVYYTKGFDGPGRPGIEEEDANEIQTLQYGSRNDAWTAMDDLYVELEFGKKGEGTSTEDLGALLEKVLNAMDSYLNLVPAADVERASRQLGQ